jgi:hypothetical protein
MSSADTALTSIDEAAPQILELAQGIASDGTIDSVSDQAVQQLLAAAVRLYAAKRDAGSKLAAFTGEDAVTATEVAVTCVGMTEVVNLELFELALWAGWSNI